MVRNANSGVWLILLTVTSFMLQSCKKETQEKQQTPFQGFVSPDNFPPVVYKFQDNKVTEAGFELGRRLFYDPMLSLDNTISCGSCHAQVHGFADHGNRFSTGIMGKEGVRNSPALFNLAWHPAFMWDGGINHIEVMPIAPLTASNEMGETLANIVAKLNTTAKYPALFKNAFGTEEINSQKILLALSQFMGMMVSSNSKYDKYLRKEAVFTDDELAGLTLFRQHCETCHKEPLFTDFSYRNNGIGISETDSGRQGITLDVSDRGKFKVPSLRNIDLTYPYMHDGRLYSLTNVLDHYTDNIQQSATLDPLLQKGIAINKKEKQQIISFLRTLTDYVYITDSRFSEPPN